MGTFPQSKRGETLFSVLFEKYRKGLYSYSLGQVGEAEAAADCLQEVFVRLWKHISRVETMDGEHQARWLYTAAKSCIVDHHRRAKLRVAQPLSSASETAIEGGQEREVILNESLDEISTAIAKLPPGLRTVLAMSVVGEMNSDQIGAALSKPAGTIRYQLSCARSMLMAELDGKMNSGSGR